MGDTGVARRFRGRAAPGDPRSGGLPEANEQQSMEGKNTAKNLQAGRAGCGGAGGGLHGGR